MTIVYFEDVFANYIIVNACELFCNANKVPVEKMVNLKIDFSDDDDIYILLFSDYCNEFFNQFNQSIDKIVRIIARSEIVSENDSLNENYLNWQFFWIEAKELVIDKYNFNKDILNTLLMHSKHNRAVQKYCDTIYRTNKEVMNKFDISEESAYRQGYSLLQLLNDKYKEQLKNCLIINNTIFIIGREMEFIYNLISEKRFDNIYMFDLTFNDVTIYANVKNHTIEFKPIATKYGIEEMQINFSKFILLFCDILSK